MQIYNYKYMCTLKSWGDRKRHLPSLIFCLFPAYKIYIYYAPAHIYSVSIYVHLQQGNQRTEGKRKGG